MPKIRCINKNSLWRAWKDVRKQLSRTSRRDITDYVEFDIDPDWWINRLLKDVNTGNYEPIAPYRFTLAKKMGFSRQMTFPHVPDLVLYRAVTDYLYKKAKRLEKDHVYFARNTLSQKRKVIHDINIDDSAIDDSEYTFLSGSAFAKWKEFNQYRKYLLLDEIYPYIVITDISNYFDSILYDRVIDAIHETNVDRNIVGLLFFILERLSIRDAFNESPRIGLPVDEFDCSRTLAHMVLFPHDRRMAELVGEGAYIRWMDDQSFGVRNFADGLNILRKCSQSLARLHLTPNSAKSKVLSLKEASRYFHFDINMELDRVENLPGNNTSDRRTIRKEIVGIWRQYKNFEKYGGEWGKILKRFYRLAGIGGARFLRTRAKKDILKEPTLARRIGDYMRVTGDARQYAQFVFHIWNHNEQVYPDVNRDLAEGFLLVEAHGKDALYYRNLASKLLAGQFQFPGLDACAAIAPLLILRFGDRRSLPRFRKIVKYLSDDTPPAIGKAVAVVYASYGRSEYEDVIKAASKLRNNYLSQFIRMLDIALEYQDVPERFKIRRKPIYDSVSGQYRIDMRKILILRLLNLNDRRSISKWIDDIRLWIMEQEISSFDKKLVKKVLQ